MTRFSLHPFKLCGWFLLPLLASVACSSSAFPEGEDADLPPIEAGGDTGPSQDVSPSKPDRVDPPVDPTVPKTVVEFVQEVNTRFCDFRRSCNSEIDATCEEKLGKIAGAFLLFATIDSLKATQQNIQYRQNYVSMCLKKLEEVFVPNKCTISASDYYTVRDACSLTTVGKLKNLALCDSSMECSTTSWCSDGARLCAPLASEGDPCSRSLECANRMNGRLFCSEQANKCEKTAQVGDACTRDEHCGRLLCVSKKCAKINDFSK